MSNAVTNNNSAIKIIIPEQEISIDGNLAFATDDTLYVLSPSGESMLTIGNEYLVQFNMSDNHYQVKAVFAEIKVLPTSRIVLVFGPTESPMPITERNFVRAKCDIGIYFELRGKMQPGTLKNISGGGALLVTKEVLNMNDTIRFAITLNSEVNLTLSAKVVNHRLENENSAKLKYGLQFCDLSIDDRQCIMLYVDMLL